MRFRSLCAVAGLVATALSAQAQILINDQVTVTMSPVLAGAAAQGLWLRVNQQGLFQDGSLVSGATQPWGLAGNPGGAGGNDGARMGAVRLGAAVTYSPTDVDIALPTLGVPWVIGRTYNGYQEGLEGASQDSNGYQGINWQQTSQPEILYLNYNSPTKDMVYLLYGADRYAEFQAVSDGSSSYRGINGAAGVFVKTAGSPDIWEYTDQRGIKTTFFGGNTASNGANWQIWKIEDPAGNVSYVGDPTTAATAVTNGYDGAQRITKAYDAAGRRYCYSYSTIDSVVRLTQVLVETDAGGGWGSCGDETMVGKVEYAYYQTGDNTEGDNGCLKMVTVTTPLTDSGVNLVAKKHYRYYKGTYNSSTNPGDPKRIKLVVGFEGCRRYDYGNDGALDDDFLTETTANLKSYSEAYFEYDSAFSINKAFFNGECGCGGGSSNGIYEFTPTAVSYTSTSAYDPDPAYRVVIKRPDATYVTQYFDEVQQPLSKVVTPGDPASSVSTRWTTQVVRDSVGIATTVYTPEMNTGYTHSTGVMTNSNGAKAETPLVPSGALTSFPAGKTVKVVGVDASPQYIASTTYTAGRSLTVSSGTVVKPEVDKLRRYHTATATEGDAGKFDETAMSFAYWSATSTDLLYIRPKKVTTTLPKVSTSNNGKGNGGGDAAVESHVYLRRDGTTAFSQRPEYAGASAGDLIFDYTKYDSKGLLVTRIEDVNPSSGDIAGGDVTDMSGSYWNISTSSNAAAKHVKTTFTYDAQGRLDETTLPDGRVTKMYYSKLVDGRMVVISIPRKTTAGGGTFFGPCSYSVNTLNGKAEAQGSIAISNAGITTALTGWINESSADPIAAVTVGTVARLSTNVLDTAGMRVAEARSYFLIPGSGAGSEGTNYDSVRYGYDDVGRNIRVKNAAGTITRTTYDTLGRVVTKSLGTNDPDEAGADNMVTVEETEYDGGSSNKNGLVTKRTQYIQDSTTGRRDTSYYYDGRNRLITTINPAAPHSVVALDNLGRTTAMAQFTSISSPSGSNAPTTTTNRISYGTSTYDEAGRAFRNRTYQVNQSTGAIVQVSSVDQFLENNSWFDEKGRVIKTRGGNLAKSVYDRLGRVLDRYTLSSDNDSTTYANAFGVSGDKVLEEQHSFFEDTTGNVLFSHSVQRNHDDTSTTGALDSNADSDRSTITAANIKGRVSITANYYDDWNRQTDAVAYGTNAIVGDGSTSTGTFTRAGSVPSRSDTELVTTTAYDTDGTVLSTTDPRALVTRFGYDGAGRKVTEIKNYDDGSPGGGTDDDKDQIVRYEFTTGRMTKMTADLTSDDQETIYTYGVTKGTGAGDSKISSNDLLWKVQYPESSGGSDVVSFAYNALGQEIYKKDQSGNVIEQTYDTAGRITAKAATTIISGFDTTVQRIELAYLSRGQTDTVTQYDDDVSGSVLNQVKYTYDEWGNVTAIEQDRDGTVGGGGNQRSVQFGYSLVGTGDGSKRQRVQRDTTTLPNGTVTTNEFTASTIADEIGRVGSVKIGGTTLASYQYIGAGQLVGTTLGTSGSDTVNRLHGGSSASYSTYLDRFGRVVKNEWFKDLGTDVPVYSIGLTYDRDSNITSVDDTLVAGYDVKYAMDNLNRLIDADEGTLSGGSIGSRTRREKWDGGGLSPTGNWLRRKLDLDGDGAYSGTGEVDDTSTFNKANEWLTRDLDSTSGTSGNNYTLAHDAAGNMTDDGKDYKYEYDVWGRLRNVKNQSSVLVAEYFYDGLGQRTGWHADWDADGTVESSNDDPWYMFVYDDRWRIVATYRVASSATATSGTIDTYPKEQFIYHNAGMDGRGGSSYIDSVMLRDRDFSTAWTATADSAVEERLWYGQNWRADMAVVMNSYGRPLERAKYSAYGVAMQSTSLDFNGDGLIDPDDPADFIGTPYDWDLDGDVDFADMTGFTTDYGSYSATLPGRGQLSMTSIANRKGYAGYEFDRMGERYHVRNRVYIPEMGRWTRRDPIGYVDGTSLYEYVTSNSIRYQDALGLVTCRECLYAVAAVYALIGTSGSYYLCGTLALTTGIPGLLCAAIVALVGVLGMDTPQAVCEYLGYCSPTGTPIPAPTTIAPVDISCARLRTVQHSGGSKKECQVNCDKTYNSNMWKCDNCYRAGRGGRISDELDEYGRSKLWACRMEAERIYRNCYNNCVQNLPVAPVPVPASTPSGGSVQNSLGDGAS